MLQSWPEDRVQTACLLVSELVTNAVLHARTSIHLRCEVVGGEARLEVSDHAADGPALKAYSSDASTGRGMWLVGQLADDWGVETSPAGKTIWCTVREEARDPLPLQRLATPEEGPDGHGEPFGHGELGHAPSAPQGEAPPPVTVHMLGVPLGAYLRAAEHNDAVMRELALLVRSGSDGADQRTPAIRSRPRDAHGASDEPGTRQALLELFEEVRATFAESSAAVRGQVERAHRDGHATLDVHASAPDRGWERLFELAGRLDELDRSSESGELLTLASSPEVRRFRRWWVEQARRQLDGGEPEPWRDGR